MWPNTYFYSSKIFKIDNLKQNNDNVFRVYNVHRCKMYDNQVCVCVCVCVCIHTEWERDRQRVRGTERQRERELHDLFAYFGKQSLVGCFICKYFLWLWGRSFILFIASFAVQKLLIMSYLFIFVFIFITLGGEWKNILLWFISKSVLPVFSSDFYSIWCYI